MSTASGVELRLPDLTRLPPAGAPLMDASRRLWGPLIDGLWRTTVHHADRLPAGACLVAANHVGVFDGPLAVALTPDSQAMAKVELWRNPVLGRFMTAMGQVPIDRGLPDAGAMRRCIQVLEAGRRLVIFPEGHRGTGTFDHARRGLAYLALVTGVPVVPLALLGTSTGGVGLSSVPRPRLPLHLVYGEPVVVEPKAWPRTAREVGDLTERLREVCAQHVQQAQREVGLELPSAGAPRRRPT